MKAAVTSGLQDYAGKWTVGTLVSFTVAVNEKGRGLSSLCW